MKNRFAFLIRKFIPVVSAFALAWSAPINAAPPERVSFGPEPFDGIFVTECIGEFDILLDFTYYGDMVIYFDKDGNVDRVFYKQHYSLSYYNSVYPDIRVHTNNPTGDNRWVYFENDEPVLVDVHVHTILTVPGYGLIEQDVGRIVWDPIAEVVTFWARGNYLFDSDALCEALSP